MVKQSILIVAWFFYPKLGGAEMIVLNQARYLRDRGYQVSVLTSKVDRYQENDEFEDIKIYRRDFINSSLEFDSDQITGQLKEIYDSCNPNIVHFHNGSYPAASKDMNAGAQNIKTIFRYSKARDCKVIEHSHNAQLKNPEATKQLRNLPWDCVFCVSQFVKSKWEELGSQAKMLKVVYNGIDLSKFENVSPDPEMLKLKDSGQFIIFFPARVISMSQGGISKQKNFELVLKACNLLLLENQKNFKLVAILNEAERKDDTESAFVDLDQLLAKYNLGEQIKFIPTILPDDMPKFYAGADIVCVPSLNETFGLVYIEAMSLGKIAIASNTGGPVEYINNEKDGFLVDPEDENDLLAVLKKILSGEINKEEFSKNAKEKAKHYSAERMMIEVEKEYFKIMGEK